MQAPRGGVEADLNVRGSASLAAVSQKRNRSDNVSARHGAASGR